MIKVCGLWAHDRKDGGEYYCGRVGNIRVLLFPVDKEGENLPRFDLYVDKHEERGD